MEIKPNITAVCLDRHTSEGNINRHTNKAKRLNLYLLWTVFTVSTLMKEIRQPNRETECCDDEFRKPKHTDSRSESGHRHILCPAEVRGTSHGPRASNINTQEPVLGLFMSMNESVLTRDVNFQSFP